MKGKRDFILGSERKKKQITCVKKNGKKYGNERRYLAKAIFEYSEIYTCKR